MISHNIHLHPGNADRPSAAAPRAASRGQVAMFDPSAQYGVLKPVGFFDPLGLSKGISEEKFFRWREIEIKHGRVCMVAFVGCK